MRRFERITIDPGVMGESAVYGGMRVSDLRCSSSLSRTACFEKKPCLIALVVAEAALPSGVREPMGGGKLLRAYGVSRIYVLASFFVRRLGDGL